MNMEYRNQDLLDQAAEAGIETYSLHLVLKTSLAEVKSYADVDMEELFAPAGTVHVSTEDAGATLSEKLAFVEEQIKAGNRQPEFLEVFKTIVFEILRQPDNSPFLTWLRRYMNYRWEGEPFSEDMFETYNSAFQKVREKGLVAPNNFFATFAAMLASSGQYDRMRSAIEMLPTTANLDGYLGLRVALSDLDIVSAKDDGDKNLLNRLQENERLFERLVHEAEGSVLIVGNGPQEVGKGRGAEVDSAGLVVRFNTFSTEYPYSEDYGTKTDVWVRMVPHPYVRFAPDPRSLKQVMITGANRLYRNYNNWDWFRVNINRLPGLGFTPSRPYVELAEKLGSIPTSGLLLSYMLYKLTGPLSRDQVLGCSFVNPEENQSDLYHYSDARSGWSKRHAVAREKDFFQKLVRLDDRKTYYTPVRAGARTIAPAAATMNLTTKSTASDWTARKFLQGYDQIFTTSEGLTEYMVGGKSFLKLTPEVQKALEPSDNALVIGFGLRGSGKKALSVAETQGVDKALAEYGLISGLNIPSKSGFKFSLMLDDLGIFFDTTKRSRAEQLILDGEPDKDMLTRAKALIDKIVDHNIVKYNDAPMVDFKEGAGQRRILVMDQTSGDLSISLGQCENYTFEGMLQHALDQKDAHVFLKLHPETVQGVKGANFDLDRLKEHPNLTLISENCNAMHLIKQMDEVYVMTSGAGLEALMAGKKVTCFGVPFYAGWGLTTDMQPFANPRTSRTLEEIVSAVFLRQTLWFDPVTHTECEVEQCLDRVLQLRPHTAPVRT